MEAPERPESILASPPGGDAVQPHRLSLARPHTDAMLIAIGERHLRKN